MAGLDSQGKEPKTAMTHPIDKATRYEEAKMAERKMLATRSMPMTAGGWPLVRLPLPQQSPPRLEGLNGVGHVA